MNKLVGYTVLVLGTLGFLLIYGLVNDGMKDIVFEKNGLQFEHLNKNQAVNPSHEPQFYSSQESGVLTFYMYDGTRNQDHNVDLSILRTNDSNENFQSLSVKALNDQIEYTEKLSDLDMQEMVDIISGINDFKGMSLSKYSFESGWFGFIDDTPIIFIFFAFGIFILCLIKIAIDKLLMRFIGRFNPSSLLLLTYIVFISNLPLWYPYTENMNSFRKIATVLLPFLLFQLIISKIKDLTFPDREVIKFFTIILGTFVIGYILSRIGYAYDSSTNSNTMMIEKHGPHPLVIGFTVALATGNLLANLVLRMIKMRGSEKILKKTELALDESSANLQSLQSTINPHFLYNSLNSIASTAKVDGDKTEKMALALSSFYKYITNKNDEAITSISEEIEMLENYLKIEKIRFEENLNLDIDINPNAHDCKLPRLLLQPLVENAIKYGYGESGINVRIAAEKIGEQLIIHIYDSGADFGSDMQIGFGIKSVTQKLGLLYPNKHTLEFKNAPKKYILIQIDQNEVK